ncbi:serine/threonine protein phosphatase [Schizosaccharomyces japonicus yFS275]|uniref:Serine/threonine-protein phosphatase n=1 Tax=Schizosaccharomyces japonicus (strain yFS275 / FY16936) TaxID=402676 RepID=B6K1C9_SCHJY|nr:serine/threonine protein phosphatase [Schizosaccharomyces japonicus yFS275]EEB07750.1 serine/threonine protein phosphatase [Schizosaccharomyces japonicus yFS275]
MDAVSLKNQGNKLFGEGRLAEAIKCYTKAIELDPENAIFYSNRSFAYLKLEDYGFAIEDATKAIEKNPKYPKGYYRRAVAHMALYQPKEALKDFKNAVRYAPNDKSALQKSQECEKLVRRIRFEEAIQAEEPPSALEGINIEDMDVPTDYDGVRLEGKMTEEFIRDFIQRFKDGKRMPLKYVYWILREIKAFYEQEPSLVEVAVENDEELVVCGDTHGQFFDLLNIFETNGAPSPKKKYLFNGDFVDRGSWSTEVALLLYSYKLLYPDNMFINRGNHETNDMNKMYGFEGECKAKYNERTYRIFSETFVALPLATLIGKHYLVLHGGLFSKDTVTLDDIRKFDRLQRKQPGQSGIMMEMLWTDPQPNAGRGPSKRGVGLQFGPDITKKFCELNNLKAVIRSHEVRQDGYEVEHDGRLITVFSAPNYCDTTGNMGAVIHIQSTYELKFAQFSAVPHPNVRPMAYASGLLGLM